MEQKVCRKTWDPVGLTTGAYRAAAEELLRIADDFEGELPELG
jgi:hypothetical protein